jgi:benzoate-CoA ligase
MRLGAIPVPVNPAAVPADLHYYLDDCEPAAAIVTRDIAARLGVLEDSARPRVILTGMSGSEAPSSFETLIAGSVTSCPLAPVTRDDHSYWLYSSGTSGPPKAVMHRHGDMPHCIRPYAEHVIALTPEDRVHSTGALSYSFGLATNLFLPLSAGACGVLSERLVEPRSLLRRVEGRRVTILFSVPTLLQSVVAHLESAAIPARLGRLRLTGTGGEVVPEQLAERWRRVTGSPLVVGIGSTEFGHQYIAQRPDDVRPGSLGTLIPGYEARLVDDAGADMPPGEVGELWVKGESVACGYWKRESEAHETFCDGWLHTGDMMIERDGHFYFRGRRNDLFKVGGLWVSPLDVEAAISKSPLVQECAVVASYGTDGLCKPRAFVVLAAGLEDNPSTRHALFDHFRVSLQWFERPESIEYLDSLPRTANGKLRRTALRGPNSP